MAHVATHPECVEYGYWAQPTKTSEENAGTLSGGVGRNKKLFLDIVFPLFPRLRLFLVPLLVASLVAVLRLTTERTGRYLKFKFN